MPAVNEAFALQDLLEEVCEKIKIRPRGRSYITPEEDAYVLALSGDSAKEMQVFMKAVGQYLLTTKNGRKETASAKEDVLKAFEEWLSKQTI